MSYEQEKNLVGNVAEDRARDLMDVLNRGSNSGPAETTLIVDDGVYTRPYRVTVRVEPLRKVK